MEAGCLSGSERVRGPQELPFGGTLRHERSCNGWAPLYEKLLQPLGRVERVGARSNFSKPASEKLPRLWAGSGV